MTNNKSRVLFGGKRARIATLDTETQKIYPSKSAVGRALASEIDTIPEDHFAWYKLIAKFPGRFVEAPSKKAKKKVHK